MPLIAFTAAPVLAIALLAALAATPRAQNRPAAAAATDSGSRCTALTTVRGPDLGHQTLILQTATLNAATPAAASGRGGAVTPALPEHCEVTGQLDERKGMLGQRFAINFRLRLPTAWNGRFFFQGGGGTNGSVGNALGALQGQQPTVALALGYAVVSQDSGHDAATNNDPQSGGGQSFGWDPRARADFGYRSYDVVTRVAKALIERHYGRAPEKSYYVGCSEGGREGMMLSQRFPEHFDGILSCAPGFRLPQAAIAALADSKAFAKVAREENLVDDLGLPLLNRTFTDEDLALATTAVLAACDDLDGLKDGMVQIFMACTTAAVDPQLAAITCAAAKTPACLSRVQVEALTAAFAPTRTASGQLVYAPRAWDAGIGGRAGTTYNQGWRVWKIGAYQATSNTAINITMNAAAVASIFVTPPVAVASSGGDQEAFGLSVDLNRAVAALGATREPYGESALDFMAADSTDLTAFRARRGRLLLVHGVSDPVFSILDTIAWWNDLNAEQNGRAAEFARLFAVPGMNHCSGGPSTDQFNAFASLVEWVEKGVAPERIIATARPGTPWPGRTRPLCPFPAQARYTGTGSIEDAANFVCK